MLKQQARIVCRKAAGVGNRAFAGEFLRYSPATGGLAIPDFPAEPACLAEMASFCPDYSALELDVKKMLRFCRVAFQFFLVS